MNAHPEILSCFKAIKQITAGISYAQLYFDGHPRIVQSVDSALQYISRITNSGRSITLTRVNRTIIINNTPIKDSPPALKKFFQILADRAIDGITFLPGVTRRELLGTIKVLACSDSTPLPVFQHIFFGWLSNTSQEAQQDSSEAILVLDQPRQGQELCENDETSFDPPELDSLKQVFEDLKTKPGQSVIKALTSSVELFMKGFSGSLGPMIYLKSLKSFDEYTFVHSINVFILTTAQAQFMGVKRHALYDIGVASVLHDVGKLFISDDILNKPGRLTQEEMRIMQTHPMKGARYLMEISGVSRLATICAMDHHILYDGRGYPGHKKWKPNLVSQMISLSDAFDAMRSRRPYQEPKSQADVIKIIRKDSGSCFNPILVDNFLKLLGQSLLLKKETATG